MDYLIVLMLLIVIQKVYNKNFLTKSLKCINKDTPLTSCSDFTPYSCMVLATFFDTANVRFASTAATLSSLEKTKADFSF